MCAKLVDTRFTIKFSQTDPTHLQVAEILNRQGRRSKAQYLVNAVLHYENCTKASNPAHTAEHDIASIEAVVHRILQDKAEYGNTAKSSITDDSITDDAIEALGEDGLSAVTNALEMFRKT